jgi:mannose-6-phosphate isomerase-like protein (cupin superfamily)
MDIKIIPTKNQTKIINKGWGYELWMINHNQYCGKILHFNPNSKCSMHYHMIKNETWFINTGEFILRYIDGENAETIEIKLNEKDSINIPNGLPHQLETVTGGEIIEISTQHYDTDSIRVSKGDSQK